MRAPFAQVSARRANRGLAMVRRVASTPTIPVLVAAAAGFTAGSMATIGTGHRARSASTAMPVAVLHATTIALAC
jgi:hypothetical protein